MPHPFEPLIEPSAAAHEVPHPDEPAAVLRWASQLGQELPLPGSGGTAELWSTLAHIAAADVEVARMVEPHLDAIAILAQAQADRIDLAALSSRLGTDPTSTWGVYAAEGPGVRLLAEEGPGGWSLTGTKPWCSLATEASHALVTAWTSETTRRLFAVPLRSDTVSAHPGPWHSRGLSRVVSAPVDFTRTPAVPIGDDGWYLARAGFSWGGMGVAAIWWGGARPLVRALTDAARSERVDQLAQMYAGRADAADWTARLALTHAADAVDRGVSGEEGKLLAARSRAVVARAAEEILTLADRALGPAPLTADEAHAKRVADLRIYLRQDHAERDLARLGSLAVRA